MKVFAIVSWVTGITWLLYGVTQNEFTQIFVAFITAFLGYFLICNNLRFKLRDLLILAILIRLISIGSFPALSDDIYRFVWDGEVFHYGMNPYEHRPAEIADHIGRSDLYEEMNSRNYYTVYPVVNQAVFILAALAGDHLKLAVIIIRLLIGLCEIGVIWLVLRWMNNFQIPQKEAAWYFLNPLLITETYGNLHFEIVMVLFILLTLFSVRSVLKSGLYFCLSASSKLLSLILLPFLLLQFKKIDRWHLLAVVVSGILLMFSPIIIFHSGSGFFSSLNLYFRQFEFNASLYYIFRWLGYQYWGYNAIGSIGPTLAILSMTAILMITFRYRNVPLKNWPFVFTLLFTTYFLFATTVHPWYIITPLIFGVMAQLRYVVLWSALVVLSYHAYSNSEVSENSWIIAIEYGILCAAIFIELYTRKKPEHHAGDPAQIS
ncbi:MAG: hypothetical protein R3275_07595 [Saprospiraceae bacterium]|nr:hypothetical protein [Saprospiraceae bacterium]